MKLYANPAFRAVAGEAWRPGGLAVTRRGLECCAWPAGALVADVGCGPGGTARLLREAGMRVMLFDREPQTAETISADACALPLSEASLDGVVCECVLSLLPEPELALREFFCVLRPGGRALISDVTTQRPVLPQAVLRSASGSCADGALNPEQMAVWFRRLGFTLLLVEDHRDAMRELAAQLLWHGLFEGGACGAGCAQNGAATVEGLGYYLWIVEKARTCLN